MTLPRTPPLTRSRTQSDSFQQQLSAALPFHDSSSEPNLAMFSSTSLQPQDQPPVLPRSEPPVEPTVDVQINNQPQARGDGIDSPTTTIRPQTPNIGDLLVSPPAAPPNQQIHDADRAQARRRATQVINQIRGHLEKNVLNYSDLEIDRFPSYFVKLTRSIARCSKSDRQASKTRTRITFNS